jgi:hypothetical protein
MDLTEINDIRVPHDFKGTTFSGFKKTDVKKELLTSLYQSKIEPACYWSAELICSGHYIDLWDTIIEFFSKHIHIENPKLAVYLDLRTNNFRDIVNCGFADQELRLRNNGKMRHLFCEIMCVLCEAKKRHSYNEVKVKKQDFDMTYMTERFKAPTIKYAEPIMLNDDPKELFVAINELGYNLSQDAKNGVNACYWIEWILEFEHICKLKKERCKCERRVFAPVDSKLQMELIWIIWDIFITESNNHSKFIQKVVLCSLNLFSLKYTIGCNRKRKQILYFIVGLLTQPILLDEEIIKDKNKITLIIQSINKIYKQIKKGEHSPGTDYLYTNVNGSNLEKTIAKLEQMNSLGEEYIPRI